MAWGSRQLELRVPNGADGHLGAPRGSRSGFTIVEVAISVGILAVLMSLTAAAMTRSTEAYQATTQRSVLEIRTRRALDRVVEELATASAGTLSPLSADWASGEVQFRQVTDIVAGAVVLGPFVRIRFDAAEGRLVLVRNEGLGDEVSAILCRNVPALLEGETANVLDDNGNGLVDEGGFSITREDDTLIVRLSAQQPDGQGQMLFCTVQTSIALRN